MNQKLSREGPIYVMNPTATDIESPLEAATLLTVLLEIWDLDALKVYSSG